jgi:BASS family bile acid:Na+ symporter
MIALAGSSAVIAPLLLAILLRMMSDGNPLPVDIVKMVATLLVTQLLPLGLGLLVRHWRPALADRLAKPAKLLSVVLNVSVIGLILVAHWGVLRAIRPSGFLGMLALVLASLLAGWLLGTSGSRSRKAMAITTAVRNVGVGLVIATSSFPNTRAVAATLAFALFQTLVLAIVALGWGRLAPAVREA